LNGQTQSQENKERNMKVFEKRQEVYHNFLENLHAIIQDGEINIGIKKEDGKIDRSVDELKDLIFQLGYLQMHTSETTINEVWNEVEKIIQCLNDYNSITEQKKQNAMPDFYSSLSASLLKIVSILKQDLYGISCNPITKDKMNRFLSECGLYVETKDFDKYEMQKYFWNELRKQLKYKGYNIDTDKSFELDIKEYYARKKNRHRWYGFSFEVYKLSNGTPIEFRVEIGNQYLYGFHRELVNYENKAISECIKKLSEFKSNSWWYGFKYSTEYDLDFFWLNSKGFANLNNPRKREKFIAGLSDEIDMYIKKFQKIAEQKGI
jgi:hypothetical protein